MYVHKEIKNIYIFMIFHCEHNFESTKNEHLILFHSKKYKNNEAYLWSIFYFLSLILIVNLELVLNKFNIIECEATWQVIVYYSPQDIKNFIHLLSNFYNLIVTTKKQR